MNKRVEEKGITLIALIITIIVLLILAGVSIAMLFGENGLLGSAQKAKEETQKRKYEEIISLAITEAHIKKEETNDKEILQEVKQILSKDSEFRNAQIMGPDENEKTLKLTIITKEGYVYYVYGDREEYVGKKEEIGDLTLDIEKIEGDIKYTYTPSGWTNKEVKVKIEITKEEYKKYKIQYSHDGSNWKDYEKEISVTENNTTIISRLTTGESSTKAYATANITNIDRLAPKEFTPTATSTTKSITVTAETTDQEKTETDGKSEISGYRFKLDNEEWTEYQENGIYTWDSLAQTTNYTITVEAKDKAGNTTTGTVTKETGTIETVGVATYTPTTWTNGEVTVTLPTKAGYTTRYTTNESIPTTTSTSYNSPFKVSNNCTITYIYTDGTNIGGAGTANITNIDKTKPTISTEINSSEVTTNSFKIGVGITDEESGLGKIKWSYKKTTEEQYTEIEETYEELNGSSTGEKTATKEKTINNLTSGTYEIKAEIYDVAGNKAETKTIEIMLGTVPSGTTTGAITFSTPTWANEKASTTISTNTTYQIQYQKNSTTGTWTTGTTITGLIHGDIVYARLWDGTNAGAHAALTIKDGTAPSAPTMTITSGTAGNNGWYTSNVVVKITAGTDNQSGVNKTTYQMSGAQTKTETTITSGGTITITAEGSTVITAYTYDVAGNKSAAKTLTINKDTTPPTITADFYESESYATIELSATDNMDISQLEIISANGSATKKQGTTKITYTMETSSDGTSTIKATDIAGNTTTKTHKIKFLYTYGNHRTSNTGGWSQNYYKSVYGDIPDITYTEENGTLVVYANPTTLTYGRLGTWYTNNSIDLTGYDTIRSVGYIDSSSTGSMWMGLSGTLVAKHDVNTVSEKVNTGYWARFVSDISNINTSKQIILGTNGEYTDKIHGYFVNCYIYSFK